MLSDNRKIIAWFLACFLLALYAKFANLLPGLTGSGTVLGQATSAKQQTGFGPLLHKSP